MLLNIPQRPGIVILPGSDNASHHAAGTSTASAPRLDMTIYQSRVATTSAKAYMDLFMGAAS
ncbi:MAG: hypothetical protein ACR2KT_11015 [Methylocella sp.]